MDVTLKLVLWLHLVSVALAGTSAFGGPVVLRMMRRADPALVPAYKQMAATFSALGRMALVLLILTGLGRFGANTVACRG